MIYICSIHFSLFCSNNKIKLQVFCLPNRSASVHRCIGVAYFCFCKTISLYCCVVYLPVNSFVREPIEDVVDDIRGSVVAAQV